MSRGYSRCLWCNLNKPVHVGKIFMCGYTSKSQLSARLVLMVAAAAVVAGLVVNVTEFVATVIAQVSREPI
jgi:hypothetical protein